MLLDELITALSDETESLSGILLKTKVFLHQIGKKDLADWANHELNGYPDDESVPDYRRVSTHVKANIVSYTMRYTSHPLPIAHVADKVRQRFMGGAITRPLAVVEDWCTGEGTIQRSIPMELNGLLGEKLSEGFNVESAWCEMSRADIRNILAQVRSRLLDFLLELKDSLGEVEKPEDLKEKVRAIDASGLFNNAIFGPNTTIVIGNQSSITATQINSASDLAAAAKELASQLRGALPASNLPTPIQAGVITALSELELAADEAKPDVGRLRKALEFVQRSLEGAAGNLIATGALTTIATLLAHAAH